MKKLILVLTMAAGFALPSKAGIPMPGYRLSFLDLDGVKHTRCTGTSTDCGTIYGLSTGAASYLVVTYVNGDRNNIYEQVYTNAIDIQQDGGSTIYSYRPVNP